MGNGDFGFGVVVTQDLLGLPNLDIDDDLTYRTAIPFLGSAVTWNRNEISSPFVESSTTVNRTRGKVMEPISCDVFGDDLDDMLQNQELLINAFIQDHFNLGVTIGTTLYQYQCEAADVTMMWDTARMAEGQGYVTFSVPRHPVPIIGGVVPVSEFVSKDDVIVGWAVDQAWAILTATRNTNDVITTATIQWPDGTPGVYTLDTASTTFLGHVDAWHATYGNPTVIHTYSQPLVTRDAAGGITVQPALLVT